MAAVARYNVLFLFAYALAFAGAYLLARELGVGRIAAAICGAAFAYAPFRLNMNGHLHVVSSGGIPLALFLLVRGYRNRRPAAVVAGWLVAAWQLSLGFTLGLQLAYLLGVLALVFGALWFRAGRPAFGRGLVSATAVGLVALGAVGAYQARPYIKVARDFPNARRSVEEVRRYSAPPKAFLAAPVESRVWGGPTASVRHTVSSQNESALFPGAVTLALAIAGLFASPLPGRLRFGLAAGALVSAMLSLGFGLADGRFGYRLLYDYAPGWDGVRTPGRLATMTSLALALLAAAGVHALVARLRRTPVLAGGAGALAVAAILVEGSGALAHPRVPVEPAALHGIAGPRLHLPTNGAYDRLYQLWSTDRFPAIANGNSTFSIPLFQRIDAAAAGFPNRSSVALVRSIGVRTVVLHTNLAAVPLPPAHSLPQPSSPALAARRSVRGLPLTRTVEPGLVVYRIAPPPRHRR